MGRDRTAPEDSPP